MQKKRKKRCIFCSGLNTKRYGQRSKKRDTAFGKRNYSYQRWFCNDCRRVFRPLKNEAINFALKIKICDLYYDSEASYRAVHRQLGIGPCRLFEIVNALGANCKSTVEVAKELKPQWSGYLFVDEKSIWIKGVEWFILLAVDLDTQDIVHWDLVPIESTHYITHFFMVLIFSIGYPFKGIISDLLPEFFGVSQRLLPKIPHQFCTYHALKATERYVKYHYSGGDKFWANRFLFVTKIICQCKTLETAQRALAYLERHQEELRRAKLLKRMNILRLRFPHLIKRFQDPNLRPDNNIIENVIRQLNQKFKKVAGFERRNTAFNSISLLIIHYRFHKFTCSRIPGNNGKSPLDLAGVDTSNFSIFFKEQKLISLDLIFYILLTLLNELEISYQQPILYTLPKFLIK